MEFCYEWVLEQLNKKEDIEGISRVGFTADGYEVFVVTDDDKLSNIPHFHYRKKGEFHTCIRFDRAEYFYHTGKEDILNEKQKEELMKFFKSPARNMRYRDNWEQVLALWNDNCFEVEVNEKQEMPDYRKLER